MLTLGPIGFLQPWILAGLIVLPVLWWLLRMIPPRPEKLWFPGFRFLLGLQALEKAAHHMPWWLVLLRMLIVTALIIALARPVYNPQQTGFTDANKAPLVLIVDNGWASAKDWDLRMETLEAQISEAEQKQQRILLIGTASDTETTIDKAQAFQPAVLVKQRLAGLKPHPFNPDRLKLLEDLKPILQREVNGSDAVSKIIWISDGFDYASSRRFAEGLVKLSGAKQNLHIIASRPDQTYGVFAIYEKSGEFKARVIRTGGGPAQGVVLALSGRGDRLAEARFTFTDQAVYTDAVFSLPLELRNQVSRLEIEGQATAGAVHLLDGRGNRLRVGIFSGETTSEAQPLLSPLYYIEKALAPYADIIQPEKKTTGQGIEGLISQKSSILILADIGQITGRTEKSVQRWIENGGMLIRFAGPRLEQRGDSLLPVSLRIGGRALGGALSWSTPQNLSAFEKKSPFYGLNISPEITVTRQVLADPVRNFDNSQIWARLTDGTPLVSAQKRGKGWSVLFHVTANSEWSNLPLSGLFVEMLQRLITLSQSTTAMTEVQVHPGEAGQKYAGADQSENPVDGSVEIKAVTENLLFSPFQVLDGFGQLVSPSPSVKPINPKQVEQIALSRTNPPGFYGPAEGGRALNVIGSKSSLIPMASLPSGVAVSGFAKAQAILLKPWFLLTALALFFLDAIIAFVLSGILSSSSRFRMPGATASIVLAGALLLLLVLGASTSSLAEEPKEASKQEAQKQEAQKDVSKAKDEFTLKAAIGTRLAYVITGDAELDRISKYAMSGLSKVLAARTAFEPDEPMGVDVVHDELVFFPILYWPVPADAKPLPDHALAKIDTYMKNGGMIIFDTRDYQNNTGLQGAGSEALQRILGKLNIPRLEEVPDAHVLKKSFYLLKTFPGRWEGGTLWVEAESSQTGESSKRARRSDGVSSILITSNDFAGAWALDEMNNTLLPVVPGGELQREMALRAGVNIVMYALTGNYKADQVHVPALLERLGQ